MDPKLSDSMPAQQDSKMSPTMSASMKSDAPAYAGEGGSDDATVVEISQMTEKTVDWNAVDRERGINADAPDRKWDNPSDGYSLNDRNNTGEGGLPQRDPDGDGDLN